MICRCDELVGRNAKCGMKARKFGFSFHTSHMSCFVWLERSLRCSHLAGNCLGELRRGGAADVARADPVHPTSAANFTHWADSSSNTPASWAGVCPARQASSRRLAVSESWGSPYIPAEPRSRCAREVSPGTSPTRNASASPRTFSGNDRR
jgi:hypothetical protein